MSLDTRKVDPELGHKVRDYLISAGVETPLKEQPYTVKQRIELIEKDFTHIMEVLGLDLEDDSLIDTPNRVAKMYVSEIFYGLDPDTFPKVTVVENKFECDEMVVEKNINVQSNCEHHFVVIDGLATVGYIPNQKVLGLSKINRIVEYFAKRPQVQERLTSQIFHTLSFLLNTENVAVTIDATHYCVKSRGVEDTGSSTVTSKLGGCFKSDPAVRAEFMSLAKGE
jgi:GTP cyclohydrolase I